MFKSKHLDDLRELLGELKGDYERHNKAIHEPSFWILANYRFGRWGKTLPKPLSSIVSRMHLLSSMAIVYTSGSFLPERAEIGKDLHLVHGFNIRIHPRTKIGDRVGIMHEVTIATTAGGKRRGAPVIGNDVFIGCGAKILGPVKIGDKAAIAANSLVVTNVPAGAVAMGVPATVKRAMRVHKETNGVNPSQKSNQDSAPTSEG